MAQRVSLLVLLLGVLAFQMKGVLGLSDESSDSSPGHRKSYYVVWMLPTQSLRARPQNIDGSTVLRLLALWPSTVVRAPVSTMACIQPQPAPIIPRPSPSPPAPPLLASTVPKGPVLTPSGQSMTSERNREASAPGSLGTCCGMPARFPLTPQVLAIPGPPTKGALHSTSFPTSSPVKEPRGDV
ncbi:COPII coat assembly protein SEC16-like isoform X2 [Sus scrofa]|nr:COPII coat assembly protein SEC16-like isoform X2 [Sus scrofa]